jgi:predicted nucleic acid-binding protein
VTDVRLALLDNTVLTNFALVERASLLVRLWPIAASTTAAVRDEFRAGVASGRLSGEGWPEIHLTELSEEEEAFSKTLSSRLGAGERSCLAVAYHRRALVATDDLRARKTARKLQIRITGTIGVLIRCVERDFLTVDSGNRLLDAMIEAGYRAPVSTLDRFLKPHSPG